MSIMSRLTRGRSNPREAVRNAIRSGPLPLPTSVPTADGGRATIPADGRAARAQTVPPTTAADDTPSWWERRRERIGRQREMRQRDLAEREQRRAAAAPSAPTRPNRGANATAIISGDTIEWAYNQTIRYSSVLVLAVSFIDTMVSLNGVWPTPFWKIWTMSLYAIAGGAVLQSAFTFFEWGNRKRRLSLAYGVPLLLDIAFTYYGFFLLFGKALTQIFTTLATDALRTTSYAAQALTVGSVATHVSIILISFWFAYYPEQTLVS